MPVWLPTLAAACLAAGFISACIIAVDLARRPQPMWIMNLVWPISALYAGPLALFGYWTLGRAHGGGHGHHEHGHHAPGRPFWQSVILGTSHCGSGCTVGDILAETGLVFFPMTLFGREIFAAWALDFVLAFAFGIAFQYYAIKPHRHLTPRQGLAAALKADALSLTAWQFGMYGAMAVTLFVVFPEGLEKTGPVYWFAMQIAMLCGFVTAYPVNWWLIRAGIKERM